MKRIVIVGAGVSGSWLANLLRDDYDLEVYDGYKRRGCRCGWGSSLSLLQSQLAKTGLDLADYWLCKPTEVDLNGVRFKVKDGIFFNKPKLLQDLTRGIEIIPRNVDLDQLKQGKLTVNADLIVNATSKPLRPEGICHTVQWKTQLDGAEEKTTYVWFSPQRVGYSWIFPLGNSYHVGAGSIYGTMQAIALVKEMLNAHNFTIKRTFCGCQKPLYFGQNLPVALNDIVCVGEAVGCVHPLTGEGILPSIRSVELLAESLDKPSFPLNYAFKVQNIIQKYEEAYEALDTLCTHRRLGMIKVIRTMTKRLKKRTQPDVTWTGKLKALLKFVVG